MSAALASPRFEPPAERHFASSAMLALAVHVVLAAALMLGVNWQSSAPDVVTVELWQPPPVPAPVVQPEPPKPSPPKVEAPPPPKPEPRIEKPDIAIKEPPKPKPEVKPPPKPEVKPAPKPVPKPVPKPAPKPVAKPAPPPPDETLAKQDLAEALAREQQQIAAERERQAIRDQQARAAAAARDRALDAYVSKIRAKVRGNILLPLDLKGNPEARVLVTQLPTGQVLDVKLVFSSGHTGYDNAVLRAIRKSDPLPTPDSPALFRRELELRFHPLD